MTSNENGLSTVLPFNPPDENTIQLLEELLRDARTGDVIGIAAVVEYTGGKFGQGFGGSAKQRVVLFLGHLRVLQMRLERLVEL
jgi:hypothetical protein